MSEGKDWECYWGDQSVDQYNHALANSITYVAIENDVLCGYSRSIDDFGLAIHVCDLLVMKEYRGKQISKKLMECICFDYPKETVYVMSDVDEYYKKLGYEIVGSIFEVRSTKK